MVDTHPNSNAYGITTVSGVIVLEWEDEPTLSLALQAVFDVSTYPIFREGSPVIWADTVSVGGLSISEMRKIADVLASTRPRIGPMAVIVRTERQAAQWSQLAALGEQLGITVEILSSIENATTWIRKQAKEGRCSAR